MKKFLLILLAAVCLFTVPACTSCSNENGISADLVYNAKATADGVVEFTWPYGGFASVNGNAIVKMCNDTTALLTTIGAIPFKSALVSNDADVAAAAKAVSEMFTVKGVEGNYHLAIVGYVKYGPIVLAFDEHYPPVNDTVVVK